MPLSRLHSSSTIDCASSSELPSTCLRQDKSTWFGELWTKSQSMKYFKVVCLLDALITEVTTSSICALWCHLSIQTTYLSKKILSAFAPGFLLGMISFPHMLRFKTNCILLNFSHNLCQFTPRNKSSRYNVFLNFYLPNFYLFWFASGPTVAKPNKFHGRHNLSGGYDPGMTSPRGYFSDLLNQPCTSTSENRDPV